MEQFNRAIELLFWPTNYLLFASFSLAVAFMVWCFRRNALAALVFGFCVLLPFFWVKYWASSLGTMAPDFPLRPEVPLLIAEAAIIVLLAIWCVGTALSSLVAGTPILKGERIASVAIIANTLHFHLAFTLIFMATSMPTWAYWLVFFWRRLFGW